MLLKLFLHGAYSLWRENTEAMLATREPDPGFAGRAIGTAWLSVVIREIKPYSWAPQREPK